MEADGNCGLQVKEVRGKRCRLLVFVGQEHLVPPAPSLRRANAIYLTSRLCKHPMDVQDQCDGASDAGCVVGLWYETIPSTCE